jgi:hypothetical protein
VALAYVCVTAPARNGLGRRCKLDSVATSLPGQSTTNQQNTTAICVIAMVTLTEYIRQSNNISQFLSKFRFALLSEEPRKLTDDLELTYMLPLPPLYLQHNQE